MTEFDPYAILGLTRLAEAGAIKSAYRKKVQTAHPDRGGDRDAFVDIVKAFEILADPQLRRLFDEAGIVADTGPQNLRGEVRLVLADVFDAAVKSAVDAGMDLANVDFIALMAVSMRQSLGEAETLAGKLDGEIVALIALRTRIRRGDGGPNLFTERLNAQIKARTERHAAVLRNRMVLDQAAAELGNYASEVELIAALEQDGQPQVKQGGKR